MKKIFALSLTATALAAASFAHAAGGDDSIEFGGYSRGASLFSYNKDNGVKGGFTLGGELQKFRLGNEGDAGFEFFLGKSFQASNGVKYRLGYMPARFGPRGDTGVDTVQAFAEVSNLAVAPEAQFWAGQRRLRVQDIHIVDHFLMNSGEYMGAGMLGLKVGGAKLAVNLHTAEQFDKRQLTGANANKVNVVVSEIATNPGGALTAMVTAVGSTGYGTNGGGGLSVVHNQKDFLTPGLTNSLFVQASSGLARITGEFVGLSQGTSTAASGIYGTNAQRIVDSIQWQKGPFGGQALVGFQSTKSDNPAANFTTYDTTLGGRISYAFNTNFKILVDAGMTARRFDDNTPSQTLNKITIAPTLSTGTDFFSRPELRFYVSYANWNDATATANLGSAQTPGFASTDGTVNTKLTNQTLVGVQYEIWW